MKKLLVLAARLLQIPVIKKAKEIGIDATPSNLSVAKLLRI